MQTIIANLTDPSWWFTSIFPPVLIMLLAKFWKHFFRTSKRIFRAKRARYLKILKNKRMDDLLIQREMFSAHAAFNVFVMFISAGFIILVLNPNSSASGRSVAYGIIISVPILISEIFWLSKDARVQDLIARRKRWQKGKLQAR